MAARRHVEDYTISAVSFRSMDDFFYTDSVAALPGEPLASDPVSLDFSVTLGNTTMGLQDALRHTHTNALLVMKDGKILYEQYLNASNPDSRFISWSMAKSVTSILFGIALEQGAINSLDDTVDMYLPEFKDTAFEGVTLKNMLMQRAGTSYSEYTLTGTPDVNILADQSLFRGEKRFTDIRTLGLNRDSDQGESFNYSTLTSCILGRVIEVATGVPLAQYTEDMLWKPAGMQKSAYWMLDGKPGTGQAFAGGGFNATLVDYARIGQLMLNGGSIDGKQVVPANWVKTSTTYTGSDPVLSGTPRGYGYQWWTFLGTEIYEAVGIHGQFISVDPKTNTVIVKLSYWPERGSGDFAKENHQLLTAIRQHITAPQ